MSLIKRKKINLNTEGAILAKLWNKILGENSLYNNLLSLINNAVIKQELYGKKSKRENNITRSGLSADVYADEMTFRVFIKLLKDVLNVKNASFTVTVEFDNGKTTSHTIDLLDSIKDDEDEDNIKKGKKNDKNK